MKTIDRSAVIKKYNSLDIIWNKKDRWHFWTYRMIKKFIVKSIKLIPNISHLKILNAGSAGNSYGLDEEKILHIDIADAKIAHLKNAIVGSIDNIPTESNKFDLIICVGSVINYCDPVLVIQEFDRVLKEKGWIILEFENSNTLELIWTKEFNKKSVFVNTFYNGNEKIWFYSTTFIKELLEEKGMKIEKKDTCHIISPFIYRISKNESLSALFRYLDILIKPFARSISSNTILLIRK